MSDQDFIEDVIKNVAISQGISEYVTTAGGNDSIGDNYFGTLIPVALEGVKFGKRVTLDVLIKIPPKNDFLRNHGPVTRMYEREIFVYTKLLPAYDEIQKSATYKFNWPKCFYVRDKVPDEMLVLQDLRSEGYKHSEGMFFDMEHILATINAVARFHSLCIVLEKTEGEKFEECKNKCFTMYTDLQMMGAFIHFLKNAMKKVVNEVKGDEGNVLKDMTENIFGHMKTAILGTKHRVIGHSDLWKNNILFQYKNGHPTTVCLVDYQTTQLCSPGFDLLYLITTSTDADLRQKNFDHLIRTYHSVLAEALEEFSITLNEIYSLDDLKRDLKAAAPACLILASHSFRNWCGLPQETMVLFENGTPLNKDQEEASRVFVKIMKDLVNDFRSYGFI